MQQLRGRLHAFADHGLALLLHSQAEGDVLEDVEVREDGVALEHHGDAAAARRQIGRVAATDQHAPAVDLLEPGEAAQQRRLAAPRRPEQDDKVAVGDLEVDVVDGDHLPEGLADGLEANVGHLSHHPSPHREQIPADHEDHDHRRRHQEEAPGETEVEGRALEQGEHLGRKRAVLQRQE